MISFNRLKDIREDNDINQEQMAKILNVKRSTYSLWELGINIIPLKNLCDFADYFDFSIDYILELTNDRKNTNLIKGLDLIKLGNNIKHLRNKKELSQENIADMIGVSQACITRYEKGLICISTSNLYKLSKKFKFSLAELCGKVKKS
jgi:transcriptional regulator